MKPSKPYIAPNGDIHLYIGSQPAVNQIAIAATCKKDAAADKKWLAEHPEAKQRIRPSSVREMLALNLPAGSMTIASRGPYGSQFREFIDG